MLAMMDCSFVAKSGKATFGVSQFWNGCASRVERGLEISVVGVVDVETEQGYTLSAEQTLAQSSLPEWSRMGHYLSHLEGVDPTCLVKSSISRSMEPMPRQTLSLEPSI